jgi:hypothetical protein
MTARPHLSATQGGGRRSGLRWWCWADLGRKVGCATEQGRWAAREKNELGHRGVNWAKSKEKLGEEKETLCKFFKGIQTNEFKHGLNSTNQKLCSSMNATINSYGSLI